ncbi:hypothetical protein LSS_21910 [Leptospira santarosai serovar Shermani str. LT 821]|uniref:Uncharacterized protein n=1 Tax=Leptospira santarosai serovar Shermani str. LT 821 TaxID=758847 RepID=A0A097ESL8_9LEPT|nr:hypothetical protein LSS_21910 [Leptospira santarosai serovar Shermani str. LT 821]
MFSSVRYGSENVRLVLNFRDFYSFFLSCLKNLTRNRFLSVGSLY